MPALSTVLVVGSRRQRSAHCLRSLAGQTVAADTEIVVVDIGDANAPRLDTGNAAVPITYLKHAEWSWARARAAGAFHARAPIVAFVEDHCYPEPGWAEALIDAHRGPWAAVAFSFTSANPTSYWTRASMVNDYGLWLHPAVAGPIRQLPGSNVSYKREALVAYGDRLEALLTPDFGLHEAFARAGLGMYLEPRAIAAHENVASLPELLHAHFQYARLLGARRAATQRWSAARRWAYAAATPFVSPPISAWRLVRTLRGRRALWNDALLAAPVFLLSHGAGGVGEALGYVAGEGPAERRMRDVELEMVRSDRR
jgi:GT2 family glycosyltransferase